MKATSLQIRVAIREQAQAGIPDRQISQAVQISRATVRKWRRKINAGQGLGSRMGRPGAGALSSFSPDLVARLRRWRQAHPGWGPNTLLAELMRSDLFRRQAWPSRAGIGRWLQQEHLSRPYQVHTDLPRACVSPAQACHEEWEMDARGQDPVAGVGVVSLIEVNDLFSRVKLISYPALLGTQRAERRPTTEDYQLALRWAFTQWGLPERLAVDHDSVFYDNRNPSPFPTRFPLWLVALGVELTFGRPGQPRDQAVTERSHQTWYQQVLQGQSFASQEHLWQALQARVLFLNQALPCASLDDLPPLIAHPEATHPRQLYRPDYEAHLLDLERVEAYLTQGTWFRLTSAVGTIRLGQTTYSLGSAWKRREVQITFDPGPRQWVCVRPGMERRLPLKGITPAILMGEMGSLLHFKDFQLALPFSWQEWRQSQLGLLLTGTT